MQLSFTCALAISCPLFLTAEEFGLAWNEARRNEMFGLVRDIFRQERAADPLTSAAGGWAGL